MKYIFNRMIILPIITREIADLTSLDIYFFDSVDLKKKTK